MQRIRLFLAFLQIGLFSIGGGYASLELIKDQVVDRNGWLDMVEFGDIVTIAEMTPGPISINSATFVGTKVSGLSGALIATFGCVLPSIIVVLLLSLLYSKFSRIPVVDGILSTLRPAVIGMIASAGCSILISAVWMDASIDLDINYIAIALIAVSFILIRKFKLNPITVMLGCGVVGGVIYSFF